MFSNTNSTAATPAPPSAPPNAATKSATATTMLTFGQLQTLASSHYYKHPESTRHLIFELTAMVGLLATSFLKHAPLDSRRPTPLGDIAIPITSWTPPEYIKLQMGELLFQLALCSISSHLELQECVSKKIMLNAKKYPIELCKGQSGKYTEYSDQTGITKTTGQSTSIGSTKSIGGNNNTTTTSSSNSNNSKDDDISIDAMQQHITAFATARLWSRFHTPRNLVLALLGELGELAELYQWRGDGRDVVEGKDLDKVGQELADVTIYLLRLASVCQVKIGDYALQVCAKKAGGE